MGPAHDGGVRGRIYIIAQVFSLHDKGSSGNRVRWVRDEVSGEDRGQVRTGLSPQLMAVLGNLVTSNLRLRGTGNLPAAPRHYGWKP